MSYQLGADPTETEGAVLARLDARTQQLLDHQKAQDERQKWSTLITVAGALFAFVRLGIIAIPHIRRRQTLGTLGEPSKNPPRRRR